jgi:hypothetical protein
VEQKEGAVAAAVQHYMLQGGEGSKQYNSPVLQLMLKAVHMQAIQWKLRKYTFLTRLRRH